MNTSVLDSPEFIGAEPTDRATWLCLLRYCAGQENRGIIADAGSWTDRKWQQLVRVTLRETKRTCPLWRWEGESLEVAFYNTPKESEVQRLRSQASNAARARWHAKRMPSGISGGIPNGTGQGNVQGNAETPMTGNAEENRIEENRNIPPLPPKGEKMPSKPRKPKVSIHPSEQPEPIQTRMLAIGRLLRRMASTRWTAEEFAAFAGSGLAKLSDFDFDEQLALLRPYYATRIPHENDFRRRDLLRVLRHWPGELDKARIWRRENPELITKL